VLRFVLNVFLYFFLPRTVLVIEIASLRQQLTIYKRQIKKPKINPGEKLLWIFLSIFWKSWKKVLFIVQPHRSLQKETPNITEQNKNISKQSTLLIKAKVGGLHHSYSWAA